MKHRATTFQAIEALAPVYEEYGEEQVIAALYFLLERERVMTRFEDNADWLKERMNDLENLDIKWVEDI